MEAKLKHLEFIQTVITRMATNSFLFKGWAITIAAGLAGFAAVDSKSALLVIALVSTIMFWGLDGYYLWLERCFRTVYASVAAKEKDDIDFSMAFDRSDAFCQWLRTCVCRPHLPFFYGVMIVVDAVGICLIRSK